MSDITTVENMNIQKNEYGTGQVLGLDIQFSKMLGDVIVENYIKQLSEEDMKLIIDYMTADLFDYKTERNWSTGEDFVKKIVKEDWETNSGSWSKEHHESVGTQIKKMFNKRFKEELQEKINQIIASEEYSKKIDDIAHDIIDYCTEGYKEDLKNSIREKLIGNMMNNEQYYGGMSLKSIIQTEIQNYIHY